MFQHRIVLGTAQLGMPYGINKSADTFSEQDHFDLLDCAHVLGVTKLDTAEMYGDAHKVIGKYNRARPNQFEINTKFKVSEGVSLKQQLEHALDQLGISQVNVYFYHRYDDVFEHENTLTELLVLKQKKLIRKIGVSVYDNIQFERSINKDEVDVIQLPFNLLDNSSKREALINIAKSRGKELQIRSIFLQGLFFKGLDTFPQKLEPLVKYISKILALGSQYGFNIHDLAMGYVLSKKEIDQIIIGVESRDQLKKNFKSQNILLPPQLIKEIDDIDVKESQLLYPYNW